MKVAWKAGCRFTFGLTEDENYRIEEAWVVSELDGSVPLWGKPPSCWPRGHFWWGCA